MFGPTFCTKLDASPNPFEMKRFVQWLIGIEMPDGHYFFDDESEQIMFASINTYCPHHRGLFVQYGFIS